MNNEKSLEQIENDYWPDHAFETDLIKKCHELRKKKINELSIENIRMLLGQNIGNNTLIPIAIEILKENILSEGDFYEGDLLINVLRTDRKYWIDNPVKRDTLINLLNISNDALIKMNSTKEIKDSINDAIKSFNTI